MGKVKYHIVVYYRCEEEDEEVFSSEEEAENRLFEMEKMDSENRYEIEEVLED